MKITQEVRAFARGEPLPDRPGDDQAARTRDFAAKQNASADTFLAAEEADKGMAEMVEKYRESGELYVPVHR